MNSSLIPHSGRGDPLRPVRHGGDRKPRLHRGRGRDQEVPGGVSRPAQRVSAQHAAVSDGGHIQVQGRTILKFILFFALFL